jgi:hypothetical protein
LKVESGELTVEVESCSSVESFSSKFACVPGMMALTPLSLQAFLGIDDNRRKDR